MIASRIAWARPAGIMAAETAALPGRCDLNRQSSITFFTPGSFLFLPFILHSDREINDEVILSVLILRQQVRCEGRRGRSSSIDGKISFDISRCFPQPVLLDIRP
jgi:hypothetical protein